MMAGHPIDIVIAGGGLPGALAALALAKLRPDLRLALVEPGASAGGGRYWPFMLTDIPPDDRWLVEPLINGAWRKYEVRFPRFERVVRTPCRVITGEKLDAALREALPEGALITGEPIIGVDAQGVSLADGRRIDARAVIDARPGDEFPHLAGGWRVTLGRMVRLADRHPFAHPLLMDLRVSQREGFRYISCVPIDGWRVLVSTSWYTDTPDADYAAMAARIDDYCRLAKWDVAEVRFEQREVLPVVAAGDFDAFWASGEGGVARLGMWAGLTHPLTGSELGPAVSAALRLAEFGGDPAGPALARASRGIAKEHWRRAGFGRFVARLMYSAAVPRRRYKVLERIYRMDDQLVERFFASSLRLRDRIKLLDGRLPVPFGRALATLFGGGFPLTPLDATAPSEGPPA